MTRPCKLQINQSGAWRDMLKFDIDQANTGAVMSAAADLVAATGPKTNATMRIVVDGTYPTPLMRWSTEKGWVET